MEEDYEQHLKIPKERVAVLIGSKGQSKKEIETATKTKIQVDSEGAVTIKGESFNTWMARQVVKAIGRGFSPKNSMLLTDEDYGFELIELSDWANNDKQMTRMKGRVIGTAGKSKDAISELMDCHISVYGKTIGIIGPIDRIQIARKAVEMLLGGAMHSTVYRMLEGERKKLRRREILGGEV
jgi:ribosomal RNA assembly protein